MGSKRERPIHDLLKGEQKKKIWDIPKQRGRKPARTLQECQYKNHHLKMEDALLRDIILYIGRK